MEPFVLVFFYKIMCFIHIFIKVFYKDKYAKKKKHRFYTNKPDLNLKLINNHIFKSPFNPNFTTQNDQSNLCVLQVENLENLV